MKAHRTDQVSLTFGLIFLGIAGWWLVAQLLDLTLPAVGWFLAGALILIGVLGLLGALRSGRAASTPAQAPPPPPSSTPTASSAPSPSSASASTSTSAPTPAGNAQPGPTSTAPDEPTSGTPFHS